MDTNMLQLYAVTDSQWLKEGQTLAEAVEAAIKGGVTMLIIFRFLSMIILMCVRPVMRMAFMWDRRIWQRQKPGRFSEKIRSSV